MKKVFILISIVSLFSLPACKKDRNEENVIKVSIAFDETDKNQKISIHSDSVRAFINWTTNSRIRMINSDAKTDILLRYVGKNELNIASFEIPEENNLANGLYAGMYPVTAKPSTRFTIPDYYTIHSQSGEMDNYLIDNLLIYTKTPYNHGIDPYAVFRPAMTVLELPLKTDSGTIIIDTITLYANGVIGNGAFIKSATLPGIFNNDTNLTNITYTDSIRYVFQQPLLIGTTPVSVKLLIWSNKACTLSHYSISINGDRYLKYYAKNINTSSAFSNAKYYKIRTLNIPQPVKGDFYQGGYVVHTAIAKNVTHCYIAAMADLPGTYSWGSTSSQTGTSTIFGTGKTNTDFMFTLSAAPAAQACTSYVVKQYTDWFLPSIDEMDTLYQALRNNPGALTINDKYWSSSEVSKNQAYYYIIDKKGSPKKGNEQRANKAFLVRPMRKF